MLKLAHDGGEIRGEGICLSIPPGAIGTNDFLKISLKACIGGPFYLPEGLQFVSPVYLIQPHYIFHKNVTLSLEVFSALDSEEDRTRLVFVTSSYKQDADDKRARLMFKSCEGELGFDMEKKIATMEMKHFCFTAMAGAYFQPHNCVESLVFNYSCLFSAGHDPKIIYCSLYYAPKKFSNDNHECKAIFSVSVNSKVYKKVSVFYQIAILFISELEFNCFVCLFF